MCGFTALSVASMAANVAGTVMSAKGAAETTDAGGYYDAANQIDQQAAERDAEVGRLELEAERKRTEAIVEAHETNARFREYEARRVREQGDVEEADLRRQISATLSQQVADFAAAGRDISMTTPLAVAAASEREGERELLKVRTATMLESEALMQEASLDRLAARDARVGGAITQEAGKIRAAARGLRSRATALRGEGQKKTAKAESHASFGNVLRSAAGSISAGSRLLTNNARMKALQ